MSDRYKLSIIIPHYNAPGLLERLLLSIPSEKDIQIIVIDDHSDANVQEQLQNIQSSYIDRNILFLNNDTPEHNAGATRNIGLEHAEGKWLLFADADDYFLEGFYDIIKQYFDLDYDIVFFSPISQQLDTGEMDIRHITIANYVNDYLQNPCLKTESCLRYWWPYPWSKLIRRSMVAENKIFFDSIWVNDDDMFSTKIGFYAKKIAASKESIYCYVTSPGSLTTKRGLDAFDIHVQEQIRKYQFLKANLDKKKFHASVAYKIGITHLLVILQRRYGRKIFAQYFKIFRQNRMLRFDIRMFSPYNFMSWLRGSRADHTIKKRFEQL